MRQDLDREIKQTMRQIANMIQRDIKRQVPQPGQNPYATGNLKSKTNVDLRKDGNGEWSILITYPFYGGYTAFGTRQYSNWREQSGLNIFERSPFSGYRKGRRGIRPQNWLSLSRERQRYEEYIREELNEDILVFVENYVNQLGIRTRW